MAKNKIEITLTSVPHGEYIIQITKGWCKGCFFDCVDIAEKFGKLYHIANDGCRVNDDGGVIIIPGYPVGVGSFVQQANSSGISVKIK